jgi:hypothetical protein
MSLEILEKNTSIVEVTHISSNGTWMLLRDNEMFLSCEDLPWFKDVPVGKILNIEEPYSNHFHWPDLDMDLSSDIIQHLECFLLVRLI